MRTLIAGVLLAFTLLHALECSKASYRDSQNYQACEELSHRWLFARAFGR